LHRANRPAQKQRVIRRSPLDLATQTTVLRSSAGPGDWYHHLLSMPWPAFAAALAGTFLGVNALFALLYMAGDGTVAGTRPDSFGDHFFFSVQTIATIGYGVMYPRTTYGHILVTIEAMLGLFGVGLTAALAFARMSLPRARIRFSSIAVISDFEGVPTLMLRAANERVNGLVSAHMQLSLLRPETTREGLRIRRFYDLPLARADTPVFALSWLAMHPITASSPLHGVGPEDLAISDFAIIVTVLGIDETLGQTVLARHSYLSTSIRWHHRFVDMIEESSDGNRLVDITRIDETEPIGSGP